MQLERLLVVLLAGVEVAHFYFDIAEAGCGFGVGGIGLDGELVLIDGLGFEALVVGCVEGFG